MMIRLALGTVVRMVGYAVLFALLMVVLAECGLFGRLEQPAMEPDQPTPSHSSEHGPKAGGERR